MRNTNGRPDLSPTPTRPQRDHRFYGGSYFTATGSVLAAVHGFGRDEAVLAFFAEYGVLPEQVNDGRDSMERVGVVGLCAETRRVIYEGDPHGYRPDGELVHARPRFTLSAGLDAATIQLAAGDLLPLVGCTELPAIPLTSATIDSITPPQRRVDGAPLESGDRWLHVGLVHVYDPDRGWLVAPTGAVRDSDVVIGYDDRGNDHASGAITPAATEG